VWESCEEMWIMSRIWSQLSYPLQITDHKPSVIKFVKELIVPCKLVHLYVTHCISIDTPVFCCIICKNADVYRNLSLDKIIPVIKT